VELDEWIPSVVWFHHICHHTRAIWPRVRPLQIGKLISCRLNFFDYKDSDICASRVLGCQLLPELSNLLG
jgi:hypothetical protein